MQFVENSFKPSKSNCMGQHRPKFWFLTASMLEAYIHNDAPYCKSQNDFCSFRRVIWLLTLCFKLISFFTFIFAFFLISAFITDTVFPFRFPFCVH